MDNENIQHYPAPEQVDTPASHPGTPPVMDPNSHLRFLENLVVSQVHQVQQLLEERARGEGHRSDGHREREGRARVQLPTFHGYVSENVSSWTLQLEMGFQADNVQSHERRIAAAATCLREAAFEWFRSATNERPFLTWAEFKEGIRRAFLPPNDQHLFRRQLKLCKQTSSVQDYVFRFRSIMGQITDMAELDKIDHFVTGLRALTASEVKYRCPETLADAIEVAIMFDAARFTEGSRGGPRAGRSSEPTRTTGRPYLSSPIGSRPSSRGSFAPMELDNVRMQRDGHQKRYDRKERRCFVCHQLGHFARDCSQGGKLAGNGRGQ